MLRSIRLRNFRSLRDTGDVELRPIVLLAGANSSGKSSFLRFFPLIRQTVEKPSSSPLLWYRRDGYVDFGDFPTTISRGATTDTIAVSGTFEWPKFNRLESPGVCRFSSTIGRNNGHSEIREFSLSMWDDTLTVRPGPGGAWALELDGNTIPLPLLASSFRQLFPEVPDSLALWDLATDFLQAHLPSDLGLSTDELVDWAEQAIDHGSEVDVRDMMWHGHDDLPRNGDGIDFRLHASSAPPEIVRAFRQYAFIRDLDDHLDVLDSDWRSLGLGVRYIGPFRSAPARFYRKEEIPVDEIAGDGNNLAMFLHSLAPAEAHEFSLWVREHFGFGVSAHLDGAHIVLKVEPLSSGNFSYNLVDMGFGISQLLPIVAQCWIAQRATTRPTPHRNDPPPSLLAIEQPELHLHPHHQYQLADMFAGLANATLAAGHHMPMIIETHSEAMIHRFGELVESGTLKPRDILVLLFEKESGADSTTVRQAKFNAEGVLEDWPIGFFRL